MRGEPSEATPPGTMIRRCHEHEFDVVLEIINDAASRYRGVIPDTCWHDPYMARGELRREIEAGVEFWGYAEDGRLRGVMGLQHVGEVTLIRHAYVRTADQGRGIGDALLAHLRRRTTRPLLVGTWRDAVWAIRFYERRGFRRVREDDVRALLRRYWTVPEEQIAASVVLGDDRWTAR